MSQAQDTRRTFVLLLAGCFLVSLPKTGVGWEKNGTSLEKKASIRFPVLESVQCFLDSWRDVRGSSLLWAVPTLSR